MTTPVRPTKIAYTYLVLFREIDRFYFGVRSIPAESRPEDDLGKVYTSSSSTVNDLIKGGESHEFRVHRVFSDADSGFNYEARLLRTLKKFKKVRERCLNRLFGSISGGLCASPNRDQLIRYDSEFRSVSVPSCESVPPGLLTRSQANVLVENISTFIHCTLFPVEFYPDLVKRLFFLTRKNGGIRHRILAKRYPVLKKLYYDLHYSLEDLHFIRDFLFHRRHSVKDVIRAEGDRMIQIVNIIGIEPEWREALVRLTGTFTPFLLERIDHGTGRRLAGALGLSKSRVSQKTTEEMEICRGRIEALQRDPVRVRTYRLLVPFQPAYEWMLDGLLKLNGFYDGVSDDAGE